MMMMMMKVMMMVMMMMMVHDHDGDDDDDDMVIELGRFGMRSRRREESLECGIQAKGSFDLARRAPQSTLPGCMDLSL